MKDDPFPQIRDYNDAILVSVYRAVLVSSRRFFDKRGTLCRALEDEINARGIDLDNFNGVNGFGSIKD